MPDNARTMKYLFQTEFDPAGVNAASKGVDKMSTAFSALGSQIQKTNFGRALENMQQFHGALPSIASRGNVAAKSVVSLTKATADLQKEMFSVNAGMSALEKQFKAGLISKSAFKEGMDSYRALRSELRGMTAEVYEGRRAYHEALTQVSVLAKASKQELDQLGVPMRIFRKAIKGGLVDVGKLHEGMRRWGSDPSHEEVVRYAELYNNVLLQQRMLQDEAQASRERLNESMGFTGALRGAGRNLRDAVVRPFKEAYGWASRIPTRISEGLKESIATAFTDRGFVSKAMGRLFNKKTIMRTLAFGPLGLASGLMAKRPEEKPGFVSGRGAGPLGPLAKSLTSFGGILKLAVGTLGPMALLMKVITPVLQTLQWALEPLVAPLQQLLSDAVLQLVPFLSEIAGMFAELANELLPPLLEMVKAIAPVFVELAKVVLPPLTKILKMTIGWITKVTSVLLKALVPVLSWVADKISWLADTVFGALDWLGSTLLDLPIIGWVLKKLGISSEALTPAQQANEGPGASAPGQAPIAMPGVNAQGAVAGEARAMTITEAGGGVAFQRFSEPRGAGQPVVYTMQQEQMGRPLDRKLDALRLATAERPDVVDRQDPEELSEPVVKAIKQMTNSLLTMLPKRIGKETKTVSLADFSAVTA